MGWEMIPEGHAAKHLSEAGSRLSPLFTEALTYAAELHATQKRKGKGNNTPYIAHLMAVCALVLESGGDEEMAIAALLHDAVEDQGGKPTLEKIRQKFGDRVARIVDGCTDADTTPKPPWKQRKLDYLAHLPQAEPDVRLVSAADKLHNARAILMDYRQDGPKVWERFTGRRDGTLWYYNELAKFFRCSLNESDSRSEEWAREGYRRIVEELNRVVAELEDLDRQEGKRHAAND